MLSGISGFGGGLPSLQQLSQLRNSAFKQADADGSGGLSFKEFQTAAADSPIAKLSGGKLSEADAKSAFAKLDADGDGSLTQAEFDQGAEKLASRFKSTLSAFGAGGGQPNKTAGHADAQQLVQQLLAQLQNSYSANAKTGSAGTGLSLSLVA